MLWYFLSLRTNTENASFQHSERHWYQLKRFVWKFQLITSLNLCLDAKLLSKFDLICWLGYHFVFVYAKITYTLTHSALASILAGVSKHYRARVNWQCWRRQFSTIFFFIKINISAMDRLVVVKFYKNIANRWLFMTQWKIMAIILYS